MGLQVNWTSQALSGDNLEAPSFPQTHPGWARSGRFDAVEGGERQLSQTDSSKLPQTPRIAITASESFETLAVGEWYQFSAGSSHQFRLISGGASAFCSPPRQRYLCMLTAVRVLRNRNWRARDHRRSNRLAHRICPWRTPRCLAFSAR